MCDVRDVHLEAFLLLGHKRCVSMKFVLINRCSQKVDTSTVTGTDRVCDIVRRRVKCIRREVWPIVRCSHLASLASLIHRRVCIPRPAFLSYSTRIIVLRERFVLTCIRLQQSQNVRVHSDILISCYVPRWIPRCYYCGSNNRLLWCIEHESDGHS